MQLKKSIIILPLTTSAIIGVMILILAFTLIKFSEDITDYFTPSILAAENLLEATSHLKGSLSEKDSFEVQNDAAFDHFQSAYSHFKELMKKNGYSHHYTLHQQDGFNKGASIITLIETNNRNEALLRLNEFETFSKTHYKHHHKELNLAKTRVRHLSYSIASLSLLILLFGFIMTLREQRIQKSVKREHEMVTAITALVKALEEKDAYTKGHSTRVADFAVAIAKELGLPTRDLKKLHLSGILHDVGKIGVPDKVLHKEGKLTAEEFAHIKAHPETGVRIIDGSEGLAEIGTGIHYHHERHDGKGYPQGLKGEEIPLCAQCIALADSYDAMTSSRPYRTALSIELTLQEIQKCRGAQWSEKVVDAFFRAYEKGHIGEKINNNTTFTTKRPIANKISAIHA